MTFDDSASIGMILARMLHVVPTSELPSPQRLKATHLQPGATDLLTLVSY